MLSRQQPEIKHYWDTDNKNENEKSKYMDMSINMSKE